MLQLYLMKRTLKKDKVLTQCRIGISENLSHRALNVGAEAAWNLVGFDEWTSENARAYETYIAYKAGIPQTLWKAARENLSQSFLDEVWSLTGDNWKQGLLILEVFKKDPETPDWVQRDQTAKLLRKERIDKARAKRCVYIPCIKAEICQYQRSCRGTFEGIQ